MPQEQQSASDSTVTSFLALDEGKKREALTKLSDPAKQALLLGIKSRKAAPPSYTPQGRPDTSTSVPLPEYEGTKYGFTPGHMTSAVGQGLKNMVQGTAGTGPIGEGSPIEIGASPEKYISEFGEQSNEIRRQAKAAFKRGDVPSQVEGVTKSLFSIIPMIGPWLNDKYNQAMSGDVGGSVAETATTMAAAKLVEHLNAKGPAVLSDLKNAFPKHAIVAAANDALESSTKNVKEAMGTSFKQARANGIAKPVQNIVQADKLDSQARGVAGFQPASTIHAIIDQTVKDKGAGNDFASATVDLSGTKMVKQAIAKKGTALSWDDLKDLRGVIDYARDKVGSGKDVAILGDLQAKFTKVMRQRADQLGKVSDFDDYTTVTKALSDHQKGIIKKLDSADTGLKFFNELSKQSNRPQLDDLFALLEKHGGMPSNYVDDLLSDHKPIHRLASLAEGTSVTGDKGGRLGALMRHPVVAGAAMVGTGAAMGVTGLPLSGRFVLSLVGAMKAADIMDRYDAAKAIRELGGPSGLTGRPTPFASPQGPNAPGTPQGPAGPGITPGGGPTMPPVMPAGSSPRGLSPALAKLLPPSVHEVTQGAGDISNEAKAIQVAKEWAESEKTQPEGGKRIIQPHVEIPKEPGKAQDIAIAKNVEKPVRKLVKKVLSEGKKPMGSNAYGPGEKGVTWVDEKTGKIGFEPLKDKVTTLESPEQKTRTEMLDKIKNLEGTGTKQEADLGRLGKIRLNPSPADSNLGKIRLDIEGDIEGISDAHSDLVGHASKIGAKIEDLLQKVGMALREYEKGIPTAKSNLEKIAKLYESKAMGDPEQAKYVRGYIDRLEKVEDEYRGPRIVKASEGAHGRTASARSGMTKDTPEARRAKAAERIAAKREEAGRTRIKTSLEEQARQLAGKVTPASLKSVSIVDIEDAAKELDHTENKVIYKGLQKLRRSQNWNDDVYRGYMEDFILKSIEEKAKNP